MNDLEYLARNVHEWPSQVADCFIAIAPVPEGWSFYAGSGDRRFTRAQWQVERDRLGLHGTANKRNDTENSEVNEMEQVTLKPGDYCDVRNATPEQRKAIADAFIAAGAKKSGSYPYAGDYSLICWDHRDNKTFGTGDVYKDVHDRLLTIPQVLNATNSGGDVTNVAIEWDGALIPPVGTVCEGYTTDVAGLWGWKTVELLKYVSDGEGACLVDGLFLRFVDRFRPIPTEEDRAVKEMKQYCEYPGSWKSTYEGFARELVKAGYHK